MEDSSRARGEVAQPRIGISFFSYTGNTKFVAKEIARGLREAIDGDVKTNPESRWSTATIQLIDLIQLSKKGTEDHVQGLSGFDVFGFGTVTQAFCAPYLYQDILNKIPEDTLRGKKAFIFSTHNGVPATVNRDVANILNKKGAVVIDHITIFAPEAYSPWNPKIGTVELWGSDDYGRAVSFGRRLIADKVIEHTERSVSVPTLNLGWMWNTTLIKNTIPTLYLGKVKTDPTLCRGVDKCGKCVRVCVGNAITIPNDGGNAAHERPARVDENGGSTRVLLPVEGSGSCTQCCRCINVCPEDARYSNRTKGRSRYEFSKKRLTRGKTRRISRAEYDALE